MFFSNPSFNYFESLPAIMQYSYTTMYQSSIKTKVVNGYANGYFACYGGTKVAYGADSEPNNNDWSTAILKYNSQPFSTRIPIRSSPAVVNIDPRSDTPEIVFGTDDGTIHVLNSNGVILYSYNNPSDSDEPIRSSPAVAELYDSPKSTDDGFLEIIVGSDNNEIMCLAFDLKTSGGGFSSSYYMYKKWSFMASGKIRYSPTIADIDDDGYMEIIFGCDDNNIYCLDHQFNEKWRFSTGGAVRSTAGIADIYQDGNMFIIIGSDDGILYCLDDQGSEDWKYQFQGAIRCSVSIANVEVSSDTLEIIISEDFTTTSNLHKIRYDKGKSKWGSTEIISVKQSNFKPNPKFNSILVDISKYPDGCYEIVASDGYSIYIIDSQSSTTTIFNHQYCAGSPVVGDLDIDGKLEVTVGSTIGTNSNSVLKYIYIAQTNYNCPPYDIKWGMLSAGENIMGMVITVMLFLSKVVKVMIILKGANFEAISKQWQEY